MLNTKTVTFPTEQDQTQLAIDTLFGDEGFLADDETGNRSAPTPSLGATCYACQPMPSTVHEDIRRSSPSCWRFCPRSLVVGLLLLLAGYFGSLAIRSPMETETAQPANTAPGVVVNGIRYRPIETFRPCDRVLGHNPELTDADRADFGPEPDPATWKLLTLRAPKHDGSTADVQMVQGPEWLAAHQPGVGSTVPISVPECGIEGMAEVISIGPCPPVKPGRGPVVLATFKHYVGSTVDVYVTGLSDPIGCTGNHPFWSNDRQKFVRADELRPGENLDGFGPGAQVERVVTIGEPQHVYNIQVQGEHVYRGSKSGVLVHNGSDVCSTALSRVRSVRGRMPINSRRYAGRTVPLENLPSAIRGKYPRVMVHRELESRRVRISNN